jgi:hypothetical protein
VVQHADKGGEMSARIESKRMTNHNTPQLSRMDLANHCAAFLGLSLLNTRAVHEKPIAAQAQEIVGDSDAV